MHSFLKKLKVIDNHSLELDIKKNDFVPILMKHVDKNDLGFFSDFLDVFSSSENLYKGEVDYNSFKIKRKTKLVDNNTSKAIIQGSYSQTNDKLIINAEIHNITIKSILIYCILLIGNTYVFTTILDDKISTNQLNLLFITIIISIIFSTITILFSLKRGNQKMKEQFDTDIYELLKNNSNLQ